MSSSSSQADAYILGRNTLASARLNLQHYLFTESFGFNIHPSIPVAQDALIADIGCGSGIWSFTFPRPANSNIRIEACDISLAQAPPKAWLPSHVTIDQLDILDADNLPPHLIGRYDVVHIRLFILVIKNGNPFPLLRNLLKLVKPGGYLHWQEYDANPPSVVSVADAPKLRELNSLVSGDMFNDKWTSDFHTKFGPSSEFGAHLVAHKICFPPTYLRPLAQEIQFLGSKEYASMLRSARPETSQELDRLASEAEEECWSTLGRGSCLETKMITWVLKKDEA